jgi:hypothetical protein
VIIYDALESPVLWVEESSDTSEKGKVRAIPVEHVRAVIEVKASFSAKTVRDSIRHVGQLSPLLSGTDDPSERYKLHLPLGFFWCMVLFELRASDAKADLGLRAMLKARTIRGFHQAAILRGEGHDLPKTARLALFGSPAPTRKVWRDGEAALLWAAALLESTEVAPELHLSVEVQWEEMNFAMFAFDIVALLQGTYRPDFLSSFYGFGNSPNVRGV